MASYETRTYESDLLVLGGGVAGALAAIRAKEAGIKDVTLVCKGFFGKDSISAFAAGVYDVFDPDKDDREKVFKTRALKDYWGGGVADQDWLNCLLDENKQILLDFEKWGVEWERDPDGTIQRMPMKRDAMRAMFHGPQLMEAVVKHVRSLGVQVVTHTIAIELLTEGGKPGNRVAGAVGFEVRTGEFRVFTAKATVLAAGACGFKGRFACHKFQTGEAPAMAYKAGALMGLFEHDGLHSTPMDFDMHGLNMFQGLGGKFVNALGEEFLREYDPELGNHTPMDRLDQAMFMEVRGGRGPCYLDMTHFTPEQVRKLRVVGPMFGTMLERAGYIVGDKIVNKIEWGAAFYGTITSSGGAVANTRCETTLTGLFACGDAMARVGCHRSLQGATVTGSRAGRFAAEYVKKAQNPAVDRAQIEKFKEVIYEPMKRKDGIEPNHIIVGLLEQLIPAGVSVIRRGDRLQKALDEVERMRDYEVPLLYASDPHYLRLANETRSMVLISEMYLKSSLLRKESRGELMLREDYPYTDNVEWLKWSRLQQEEGGGMKLWLVDVPIDEYKVRPPKERYLHEVFAVAKKRGVPWG
jgi:succinate dehydrogenase / fumarate reductase, flavoprotein subunit